MFTLLGNPTNRRVQHFEKEVLVKGLTCKVFSYADVLAGRVNFAQVLEGSGVFRIESPGEDQAVREALIQKGKALFFASEGNDTLDKGMDWPLEMGEIGQQADWYRGFSDLLNSLEDTLAQYLAIRPMNNPASIRLMFDKLRCQEVLRASSIPVPKLLGVVNDYAHLRELMEEYTCNRLFVKLLHASSASGVLAFRQQGNKLELTTSVEMQREKGRTRLFNSLKISKYTDDLSIQSIVDTLAKNGLYAEQWIPKASLNGRVFDLRVIVIGGVARHVVVRQSQWPITNLHLGNARGDLEAAKELLGREKWDMIRALAENAVNCINGATYAGVDILVDNRLKRFYVLEINAFGDLLPNLWHRGESVYEAQVNFWKNQTVN